MKLLKNKEMITIKFRKTVNFWRKEKIVIGRKQREGFGLLTVFCFDLTNDYTTICFVITL